MARREKKGKRQEWDIFRGTRVLKVRCGRANAGITDAGNHRREDRVARLADAGYHRRGIRVAEMADAEKSRL